MISETDLDFYRFTSSTTIFGLNKSVICIFIEIHRDRSAYTASRVTPPHSIHLCFPINKIMIAQKPTKKTRQNWRVLFNIYLTL